MKVRFSPQARRDLRDIHTWLSARSVTGAATVLAAILNSTGLIGQHPAIGRRTEFHGVRVLSVVRHPYLIYYSIEADKVVIVHIRHGSRDKPDPGNF